MPDFYTFKWLGFSGQGHNFEEFAPDKLICELVSQ
jgi:hypothetical protein